MVQPEGEIVSCTVRGKRASTMGPVWAVLEIHLISFQKFFTVYFDERKP